MIAAFSVYTSVPMEEPQSLLLLMTGKRAREEIK